MEHCHFYKVLIINGKFTLRGALVVHIEIFGLPDAFEPEKRGTPYPCFYNANAAILTSKWSATFSRIQLYQLSKRH